MLVGLIVVAALLMAFGLQILSRHLQRFPIDGRRPELLVDATKQKVINVRPAELHRLTGIMSDALSSQTIARNELQPRLHQLAQEAPNPVVLGPAKTVAKRRGLRGKARPAPPHLEDQLAALEAAWGVTHQKSSDR